MLLLTKRHYAKLIENGQPENIEKDHFPVVKLFDPCGGSTWLLTYIDPDRPKYAFGLCDLGLGFPELGFVDLTVLASIKNKYGRRIERDRYFTPRHRLSVYTRGAYEYEGIVERDDTLAPFV